MTACGAQLFQCIAVSSALQFSLPVPLAKSLFTDLRLRSLIFAIFGESSFALIKLAVF